MRKHRVHPAFLSLAALLLLLPGSFLRADETVAGGTAEWKESTPGRWNSLPERRVEEGDHSFRASIVLTPGTGVLWEKNVNKPVNPGTELAIMMESSGVNTTSHDYQRYKAYFPVSVTVVFGKDFVDLPWKKRLWNIFRGIWHGSSSGGIRMTFAYGNVVPVGSMYRLGEEETVFLLAGREEHGRKIESVRDLRADFLAAYGREPRGPVTRILVSAQRPADEDGPIDVTLRITSPLIR